MLYRVHLTMSEFNTIYRYTSILYQAMSEYQCFTQNGSTMVIMADFD